MAYLITPDYKIKENIIYEYLTKICLKIKIRILQINAKWNCEVVLIMLNIISLASWSLARVRTVSVNLYLMIYLNEYHFKWWRVN